MAPPADPYRTLGLSRGASIDEVRRAYRRLAKLHHPDTGGEAAVPRFLAIRAAYEQIVGPGGGTAASRAARPPAQPWSADPDRADATRRAYGGRARRTRQAPGGRSTPPPKRPRPPDPGAPDPSSRDAHAAGPSGRSKKATLGSTSYDGADREPFDPDWGGASWYGTTSGTYWTINPKEYADPRKHGPEYQARARRMAAEAAAGAEAAEVAAGAEAADVADDAATPANEPPPTATTESWWDATAGPIPDAPGDAQRDAGSSPDDPSGPTIAGGGATIGGLARFAQEVRRRIGRGPRP